MLKRCLILRTNECPWLNNFKRLFTWNWSRKTTWMLFLLSKIKPQDTDYFWKHSFSPKTFQSFNLIMFIEAYGSLGFVVGSFISRFFFSFIQLLFLLLPVYNICSVIISSSSSVVFSCDFPFVFMLFFVFIGCKVHIHCNLSTFHVTLSGFRPDALACDCFRSVPQHPWPSI